MTDAAPHLMAGFWRTRRSAAIAGIIFGVLLLAAMIMLRIALSEGSLQTLQADTQRRTLIRISLGLVPFAGIAFLWFIGVVREQLGAVEDRLFSTVFMGSGLLFLAMLFTGSSEFSGGSDHREGIRAQELAADHGSFRSQRAE
jgi:heme/copper-type cytochrome/quinol oxidase subunit 2